MAVVTKEADALNARERSGALKPGAHTPRPKVVYVGDREELATMSRARTVWAIVPEWWPQTFEPPTRITLELVAQGLRRPM
jgi:hypothetical protein